MARLKLDDDNPVSRREFAMAAFVKRLGDGVLHVQRARSREERSLAVDELLATVRAAKDFSRTLIGSSKRRFIRMAEEVSGLKLQAPDDVAFVEDLDLSDRLQRYTRRRKDGEPEMKLMQLAVKTEAGQSNIVAIAESDGEHCVITGTLGGNFEAGTALHIDDVRQKFNELVQKSGYREVSPAAFSTLK